MLSFGFPVLCYHANSAVVFMCECDCKSNNQNTREEFVDEPTPSAGQLLGDILCQLRGQLDISKPVQGPVCERAETIHPCGAEQRSLQDQKNHSDKRPQLSDTGSEVRVGLDQNHLILSGCQQVRLKPNRPVQTDSRTEYQSPISFISTLWRV